MRTTVLAITAAIFFPGSLYAEDSMTVATQLGALLAAESACGMTYDKEAISGYIEKNVADDDLSFASILPMMVKGQGIQIDQMTESSKMAFCTQQRRVAKKLGFAK
ncbi:signal recognition particle [Rhizobium sp. SG741]|uniref:signal recognition particle n=1 Tax=Rhizobium sp. SG741 TaxID=2587114 RepID=UPI001445121B|nr:signal recognition particle [Rhizobium sp. SG741]NKJ03493.1 putative membrane protein [Rhizobium sp. SG741]